MHYTIFTLCYSIPLLADLLSDVLHLQIYSSQAMVFFYIYKDFKPITKLPQTGIEPVREYKSRRILSPVRLPVPPLRHNGRWWIRTTEGFASRFTVCPLWPLGKSPKTYLILTDLNYNIDESNCKYFSLKILYSGPA